jgi:hypothetical protein
MNTMSELRELPFQCRFDSTSRRRVGLVRAWDASEAIELFEVELRADGVEEAGEVTASPLRGGRTVRARLRRRTT